MQTWWYLIHVTAQSGASEVVTLGNCRESRHGNFSKRWVIAVHMVNTDRAFPMIRWRGVHVCHSMPVFNIIEGSIRAVMGKQLKDSFILHNGSDEMVTRSLGEWSIPAHCVPREIGERVTRPSHTSLLCLLSFAICLLNYV